MIKVVEEMHDGLGKNLKVGDEVFIVEQSDYTPSGKGFGINKDKWEKAISGGPYTITGIVTETWSGGWLGYKIDKELSESSDFTYTWPCWAFEFVGSQSHTDVEDLL